MINLSESSLMQYQTDNENLFNALNSGPGIALVEMPGQLNPQGLVTKFAQIVRDNNLINRDTRGTIVYQHPRDLHPDITGIPTDDFWDFDNEIKGMFSTVTDIVGNALPASISDGKNLSMVSVLKSVLATKQKMNKHLDSNIVTAWLGCENSGLVLSTGIGDIAVSEIPEKHVLLTRQRNWMHYHPDLSDNEGIEHRVESSTDLTVDFRTSAVGFISLNYIPRTFDDVRDEYLKSYRRKA